MAGGDILHAIDNAITVDEVGDDRCAGWFPGGPDLLQETGRDPIATFWASRHRPAPAGYPAARIHRCAIPIMGAAWGDGCG